MANVLMKKKHLIDQWYQLLDDSSLLPISEKEMNGIEEKLWKKIQGSISLKNKSSIKKNIFSCIKNFYCCGCNWVDLLSHILLSTCKKNERIYLKKQLKLKG